MTLRAENTSAGPIENEYTPPRGSFWVEDRDHQVWRWSRGRGFPQAVTEETFAPGEEKTEAVVWAQRLCNPDYPDESGAPVFREGPPPPGRYTAWGVWATHNVPKHATGPHAWWATPVTFEIVADS